MDILCTIIFRIFFFSLLLLIVATCCNKHVSKETIKELRAAVNILISAGNGLFLAGQAEGKTFGIIFHIFIDKTNTKFEFLYFVASTLKKLISIKVRKLSILVFKVKGGCPDLIYNFLEYLPKIS